MKFKLKSGKVLDLPDNERGAVNYMADLFRNRGELPDSDETVDWSDVIESIDPSNADAVTASEITPLLAQSMSIILREPVEPLATITSLYNRVQSRGLNTQVLAGALGAVTAGDVQEYGTYPEVNFTIGGAMQTAWIGKSGIAASFTDEALRYATWDIMSINLRLMGNALVRHKEQKAVSFLRHLGVTVFDNAVPANSMYGVTTGRGIDFSPNGTMSMDDVVKVIAHADEEGYPVDTILMNPLFFMMWLQDPVLRAMAIAHGGGAIYQGWTGNPGPRLPWSNGPMGGMGPHTGHQIVPGGSPSGQEATPLSGRSNRANSAPQMLPYFPWRLNIITSPTVPFDPTTQLGDIYFLSSGRVGFHLVDEEPTTIEWRDEEHEAVKVKVRERYGFAVGEDGMGVRVAKNIKLARQYWDGTIRADGGTVTEIDPDAVIDLG